MTHRMCPSENGFVMADTRGVSLHGYPLRNDFTGRSHYFSFCIRKNMYFCNEFITKKIVTKKYVIWKTPSSASGYWPTMKLLSLNLSLWRQRMRCLYGMRFLTACVISTAVRLYTVLPSPDLVTHRMRPPENCFARLNLRMT